MKKIETAVDAVYVPAIVARLRALGIRRITAVKVEELGDQGSTAPMQLNYRGVSASLPPRRVQLQIIEDDIDSETVVNCLLALAKAGHVRLDTVQVYPFGTLTIVGGVNSTPASTAAVLTA